MSTYVTLNKTADTRMSNSVIMAGRMLLQMCLFVCLLGQATVRCHGGFKIKRLDHLVLTVADSAIATDFYTKILGMDLKSNWGPTQPVHFGLSKINLRENNQGITGAKYPTPGSADLCFITDTHIDKVIEHLKCHNVSILEGPVWRPGAIGGITSVYFRDPDGNLIEVSNYA